MSDITIISASYETRRSDSFDAGRAAERRIGADAHKLRRLIEEAERVARFLDGLPDETARYRARELRREIAEAQPDPPELTTRIYARAL